MDKYQQKYLKMIEKEYNSGGDESGLLYIIDELYGDGYDDGENEYSGDCKDAIRAQIAFETKRKKELKNKDTEWTPEYHEGYIDGLKQSLNLLQ